MNYRQTATATAKGSALNKEIDMIGPFFGAIGFVWGYILARKRGGRWLDRLQYGAGFSLFLGLFCTFLWIVLGRFLGSQ